MKNKTCCFTGHRKIEKEHMEWLPRHLRAVVSKLASMGVTRFCCGGAIGFDTLAAKEVLRLRETNPKVKLCLFLPCREQSKYWTPVQKAEYEKILSAADEITYVSEHYYRGCMLVRNRRMVDESAYCVSYLFLGSGGTAYTVAYAEKQGVRVVPLFK